MDEERQENDGLVRKAGEEIKKGAKKQAQKTMQKVLKKMIVAIAPVLIKIIVVVLLIAIIFTGLNDLLDKEESKDSKDAISSSLYYTDSTNDESESSLNKIVIDRSSVTSDGAYILKYEFRDKKGNILSEDQAIKNIKKELANKNENLSLKDFSDSELKIIGTLMYNGLKVEDYNQEQLKALAIFVKADIAANNFDLRSGERTDVNIETLRNSDTVYGTLELYKTTIQTDETENIGYNQEKMYFTTYGDETTAGTFCYMVKNKDEEVKNKFSIDEEGNLVIARWGSTTTTYTYLTSDEKELPIEDKEKIIDENIFTNESKLNVTSYSLPINYKNYISSDTINYDFLVDLLITTKNAEFCEEIAEMAMNSKIVFNVKEELTIYSSEVKKNYTQTVLLYDYVKYEISGQTDKSTSLWETVASDNGKPGEFASRYGWNTNMQYKQTGEYGNTLVYEWTHTDKNKYQLKYTNISSYQHWTLYKLVETTETTNTKKETNANEEGDLINLNQNHINEDGLDEDYTSREDFEYIIIEKTDIQSNRYDLDLFEIDSWYKKYKKEYVPPTLETTPGGGTYEYPGTFSEELKTIVENTSDKNQIDNNKNVQDFITDRIKQYKNSYPDAKNIECKITSLTEKQRFKLDVKSIESSEIKTYSFGEEDTADVTEAELKNVEYINGQATYTETLDEDGTPEISFLSIYNKYRTDNIDLYLNNDAETKLFEMLEESTKTEKVSDILKGLLYIYDGIDRGVTDLKTTLKVPTIKLVSKWAIRPFGTTLDREDFIEKAVEHCGEESLFAELAGDFYDICTKKEYNVNPCIAFIWAATESDYGRNAPYNNLFGMNIGNGMSSGTKYNSYQDSIEDFCKWVVEAGTPGTSKYEYAQNKAEEYYAVNEAFYGTPESNIYVLFSTYSYLGNTHIVDEKGTYSSDGERYNYYIDNGSTWGAGGRIQIYYMYEYYLYEGEYASRCTHKLGTDKTTLQEKADYAEYTIKVRLDRAKEIFGEDIFLGEDGYFEEINDGFKVGIYTSRSGRKYTEWVQTTGNEVGKLPMFTEGKVMGNYGCNVYGMACILSSTGIETDLREVYNTYRACGDNSNVATMKTYLKKNGVDAEIKELEYSSDVDARVEQLVSVLTEGKGVLTWVGTKYNCLYTSLYHWLTVADIRESQLGSIYGYDVYVLPSGGGNRHGWHEIETIADNLAGAFLGYYIDD